MLEVVDDLGLGLDKQLLRSYYLKRSKKGRRFPPRTVGLWFEEGVIDDFREAIRGRTRRASEGQSRDLLRPSEVGTNLSSSHDWEG